MLETIKQGLFRSNLKETKAATAVEYPTCGCIIPYSDKFCNSKEQLSRLLFLLYKKIFDFLHLFRSSEDFARVRAQTNEEAEV